jgi:hypothetical protein
MFWREKRRKIDGDAVNFRRKKANGSAPIVDSKTGLLVNLPRFCLVS